MPDNATAYVVIWITHVVFYKFIQPKKNMDTSSWLYYSVQYGSP